MKKLIFLSILFCTQVFAQSFNAQMSVNPGTNLPMSNGHLAPARSGSVNVNYRFTFGGPNIEILASRRSFSLQFSTYEEVDISFNRYQNYPTTHVTLDGMFDVSVNLEARTMGEQYHLRRGQVCRMECVAIVQEECHPSDRDRYGNCPAINPTPDRPHCINQQVCQSNDVCVASSQSSKQIVIDIVNRYAPAQAARLVSAPLLTSNGQRQVPRHYCR